MTNKQLKHSINDLVSLMEINEEVEYGDSGYENLKLTLRNYVTNKSKQLSSMFTQEQFESYIDDVTSHLCDTHISIAKRVEVLEDVTAGYLIGGLA